MHNSSCFITLTYDQVLTHEQSLDVQDWQDFAKRLRHKIGKFRFFHCGEYGDKTYRKHLHAVLFGADFTHDRKPLKMSGEFQLYESETLSEAWGHGFANCSDFSFETAAYVARYIMKKQTGPHAEGYYERFSVLTGEVFTIKPPYTTMSRNPGIGAKWFDKFHTDVFPSDEVIINGTKTRPPAYYDSRLSARDPQAADLIKSRRKRRAIKHAHNNTAERLKVREKCHELRLKKFTREQI